MNTDTNEEIITPNEAPVEGKHKPPKKKKSFATRLKIFLIVVVVLVIAFFAGVISYFKLPVSDYYKASNKTFKIPEISTGFIPQGLAYDSASGDFYITGYMKDHSASPIYIVDKDTRKVRQSIRMANPDGTEFTGHNGGISVFNGKVYVAGSEDGVLYVYDPSSIRACEAGSLLPYESVLDFGFNGNMSVAFTTTYNGQLIVGEFYREQNYKTSETHWVTTTTGSTNKAIAISYIVSGNNAIPTAVYSLPDQVQGMYIDNENIYLSTSYGVAFSHILTYSQAKVTQQGTFNVNGVDAPLYILDDNNLISDAKIAPMSEEIEILDGKMYVMCESASDKYIFGKFTGARRCYATDMDFFAGK